MSIIDTINKAQDLGALEKGAFMGNQHVEADGGVVEYHSGVKGTETFKSQAVPTEGVRLTAKAEGTGLWRATVYSVTDKAVKYSAGIAHSSREDAMQHGREVLAGRMGGFY